MARILTTILIGQLILGTHTLAYANDDTADSEGTPEYSTDDYDSAMADAAPTAYDQTDVQWAEQNLPSYMSYFMFMSAGITGLWAAIKCPQLYAYAPTAIYMGAGIAQMLAEVVTYIVYSEAIKNRTTLYEQEVIKYEGMETTTQVDAVEEAKGIHEDLKTALEIKLAITSVATVAYGVAMVMAIIYAVKNQVPVAGWIYGAVEAASKVGTFGACAAIVDTEITPLHQYSQNQPEQELVKLSGNYISQILFQGHPNEVNSFYAYQDWQRFLSGELQSSTWQDYEQNKTKIESTLSSSSPLVKNGFSSTLKWFTSFASNIIFPKAMAAENTTESDQSLNMALDIALQFVGGAAMMLTLKKVYVGMMGGSFVTQAILFGVFVALGISSDVFIAIERDKVKKRIDEYDVIIEDLKKSSGGTVVTGVTTNTNLTGQTTAPTSGVIQTNTALGCVGAGLTSDPNCSCSATNSCYKTTGLGDHSQDWGFSMPSWGTTATNNSSEMVNSLAKGDYGSANSLAKSSGQMAMGISRAKAQGQNDLLKVSEGKFNLSKQQIDGMKQLKAKLLASLSEDKIKSAVGLNNLGSNENEKVSASSAKDLLQTISNKIKDNKKAGGKNPFDFNLNLNKKEASPIETNKELSTDQSLNQYDFDTKDIHGDDVNLFDVVHSRYVRSYERLFKAKTENISIPSNGTEVKDK